VLQKENTDWVKKCTEYEVEGSRPRGRPKRMWREVVQKDCQAQNLNREDAMDRSRWKKLIKLDDGQDDGWVNVHNNFCISIKEAVFKKYSYPNKLDNMIKSIRNWLLLSHVFPKK